METIGNTKKAEMKWVFRNVASLELANKKPGESLHSSYFHADDGDEDVKWCLRFYPNGTTEDLKGQISAFLVLCNSSTNRSTINTKFTFTLTSKEREEEKILLVRNALHTISLEASDGDKFGGVGWNKLIKLSDLLENDVFSLTCKLEYSGLNPSNKSSVLACSSVQLSNEELSSSLNRDLEQFFNNRSEADVCFVINGKEIKAHKMILSARSPVFFAMLKSGMKESTENRVQINDIAPDTFEVLLRFIYTDRVDVTQIDAKDLLAAANKYLLPLLKLQCQQFLCQTITLGNYVELLLLADLHNAVHLKKSVLNFIRMNRENIMQTDAWKNFKQSRPDLSFVFDVVETLL